MRTFLPLTPEQMEAKLLREARVDLVEVEKQLEYYAAMQRMLTERIQRLQAKENAS